MNDDERASMEAGPTGGIVAYIGRLREAHQPTFAKARSGMDATTRGGIVYSGCSCGGLDPIPYLLLHIDDLKAAYEAKVEDFARETLRSSELEAELRVVRDERDRALAENEKLSAALRYVSCPTMARPSGVEVLEFADDGATDRDVRAALTTCIRVARAALAVGGETPATEETT